MRVFRLVGILAALTANAPAFASAIAGTAAQVQALACSQTATLTVNARVASYGTFVGKVELAPALDVTPPGAGPEDLAASAPTTPSIACRTDASYPSAGCAAQMTLGTTVILQAADVSNAAFVSWTGCTSLTPGPPGSFAPRCNVSVTGARTVTASFKAATFELRARTYHQYGATGRIEAPSTPPLRCQTGSTDPALQACSGFVPNAASITARAVPNVGARVVSWTSCTPSPDLATCTTTMTQAKMIYATFAPTAFTVNVGFQGGHGTVTGVGVNCSTKTGGDCTGEVALGGTYTLTATPDAASKFMGWTGCSSASGNLCTLTGVTQPKYVTATFKSALCNACHGVPPAAPHVLRYECGLCHSGYTSETVNTTIHTNGNVEFAHPASCGGSEALVCADCHPCGGVTQ